MLGWVGWPLALALLASMYPGPGWGGRLCADFLVLVLVFPAEVPGCRCGSFLPNSPRLLFFAELGCAETRPVGAAPVL